MDDLNKNQLILLALLVSFVTSIATGIATVSLIDQAPAEVTRVINRVVERTVETVSAPPPRSVEETIVLREEDLITKAIAENQKRTVHIYDGEEQFVARGLVISEGGRILTVAPAGTMENLSIRFDDGTAYSGEGIANATEGELGFVRITSEEAVELEPVTYPDASELKLGQTVVALSGQGGTQISLGAISELSVTGEESQTVQLGTTISYANLTPGSVIVNLSGDVLAIVVPDAEQPLVTFPVLTRLSDTTSDN